MASEPTAPPIAADEAVAGEDRRARLVRGQLREQRVLERQEDADVAARGIERADEGDEQQRPEGVR